MHHGVLVVDKPPGITSSGVVSRVRRLLNIKKVGHTGTLDPMATGVLPLCIGEATKISGYLQSENKSYEATILLGVETDTLDAEGRITGGDIEIAKTVRDDRLAEVVNRFRGEIDQVPPMFSAISQNGQRLHKLARQGKTVERKARQVRVDRLEVVSREGRSFDISVDCSKGTYIRSLASDIGNMLGCGAHITKLRRTKAGAFELKEAKTLEAIQDDSSLKLVGIAAAIEHLPSTRIDSIAVERVAHGKSLSWQRLSADLPPAGPIALLNSLGSLIALIEVESNGQIRYLRVFTYALTEVA